MSAKRKRYKPRRASPQDIEDDLEDSEYFTKKPEKPSNLPEGVRLSYSFFNTSAESLAKGLLGKILVRQIPDGPLLKGHIVETEIYPGGDDKASQSYQGKVTTRNEAMFMKPGTIYVYLTYGMYAMMNISSLGEGSCVLLRALEPLQGTQEMENYRNNPWPEKPNKRSKKSYKKHELCNGPAKLCISLQINKTLNKKDLCDSDELWIENDENMIVNEDNIVYSRRIGIDSAGTEYANKLYRYYLYNNKCVSKRDKVQENKLLDDNKLK